MSLQENLKKRREELRLTLEEVAQKVGITRSTLFKYESGAITNIPSDKIEKLAKALYCSPSFLMGWESAEEDKTETILKTTTALAKEQNLTLAELAAKLEITLDQLHAPTQNITIKIARFFNVSLDYLLGLTVVRTRIETTAAHMINPYHEFTEEEEEKIQEYINFIRSQTKEKNKQKKK